MTTTPTSGTQASSEILTDYLNRSSNALRALAGGADLVSRSTVVRGSNNVQVLRVSFGEMRAGIGCWHSNGAPVSKCRHCAHVWRSAPQRAHRPSGAQAAATVSSLPHPRQRTTSRKPGMLKVFGAIGGCPRGVYSFFSAAAVRAAALAARPGSRAVGTCGPTCSSALIIRRDLQRVREARAVLLNLSCTRRV